MLVVRTKHMHMSVCITHWEKALSIGVAMTADKKALFVTLVDHGSWIMSLDLKQLKPVSCQIQLICCTNESLRCLGLEIWRFLCSRQRQRRHDRLLYQFNYSSMRSGRALINYWGISYHPHTITIEAHGMLKIIRLAFVAFMYMQVC